MTGEETTGVNVTATESVPEPATVFGFAPPSEQAVAEPAPEPAADQRESSANESENTGEASEAAAPQLTDERQQNAFESQRKRYQREIENLRKDPAMEVGEQLIRDVMRQNNVSRDEAVGTIRQRFVDAYAKRENIGPDAARKLMQMDAQEAREAEGPSPEERAKRIVDDLLNTDLPEGFDTDAAVNDEAFQKLLVEYPVKAAVRIYQAERKANEAPKAVADRLRARQSVPASTRPQQPVNASRNYRDMSSEDFFALKERLVKDF